jgi:GcrA cell cycle regulator
MDWSAEAIDRLKALWAEGHSTAEIGRRMGISKNAVVGKAHRLNLSARPSPIRREAGGDRPAQPSAPRAPRPAAAPRSTLGTTASNTVAPASISPPAMVAAVQAAPPVLRAFPRLGAQRSCCWPIGEPGTPGFRFCSAEAFGGKPYCQEHAAVAYVRARDRREDAA